jgi:1-acyl-sn-glycerol-3-phosphate acyltransferase
VIYGIVHTTARYFFDLYGSWEVLGRENIPRGGAVIIAPNHISYLDPPLVGAAVPRACVFMARHDLWDNPILNWLLPYLGAFPVKRGEPDRSAIRRSVTALSEGRALILFPEGTRSSDGTLQAGEAGVALIVQKSRAPVVPCAVFGSNRMMTPGEKGIRRAKLRVVFGAPIHFADGQPRDEILNKIMTAIARLIDDVGCAAPPGKTVHEWEQGRTFSSGA